MFWFIGILYVDDDPIAIEMSILISFILRKGDVYSPLFIAQQLPHLVHLIFRRLRLVRPRSSPDIRLDAHYPLLMKHSVCLSDDLVDSIPRPFYNLVSMILPARHFTGERLPSVVPAECMVYFRPDFSMRRWTSAI